MAAIKNRVTIDESLNSVDMTFMALSLVNESIF
jgi:hypothetical protein